MQLKIPRPCGALAVLLAVASPLFSLVLPTSPMLVCDSSGDKIVRFEDRDGSGFVEPTVDGEISVFYDDLSPGPDLSTPSHLLVDREGRIYFLDGGTVDAIGVLDDKNGDGDAQDDGEVSVFYDASTGGPKLSTANTLALLADGSILACDDGSGAKRVLRFRDLNGDGDALDEGEVNIVYDASALSLPVLADIEALVVGLRGELYVAETTQGLVARLTDVNADGDYLDEGELAEVFRSTEAFSLGDVDALAMAGNAVLSCDSDGGKLLRLEDKNGDGDALDEGEASVFFDDSAAVKVSSVTDILPLEQGFILLDNTRDSVVIAEDLNGDLDINDEGETVRWLADGGATLATPSGVALLPKQDVPPPPPPTFLRGDVTGDGKLDISDPVSILGYLFLGRTAQVCIDAYDSDDSGNLNISDAVFLLLHLFGGGPALPPPFGAPGPDPSDDSLQC